MTNLNKNVEIKRHEAISTSLNITSLPFFNRGDKKQISNMENYYHTFFIPVMGTGHSADTPIRLAPLGISSVISLVDDILLEKIRKYYNEKYNLPYSKILKNEVDGRANDATLTLKNSIDLSGKSSATLTYSWFIERSWDSGEYIALDVYDGSWQQVAILRGNVDQENVWHHETIDLSSYMSSNFKLRFRAKVSRSNEDGHVDNVKIISYL